MKKVMSRLIVLSIALLAGCQAAQQQQTTDVVEEAPVARFGRQWSLPLDLSRGDDVTAICSSLMPRLRISSAEALDPAIRTSAHRKTHRRSNGFTRAFHHFRNHFANDGRELEAMS